MTGEVAELCRLDWATSLQLEPAVNGSTTSRYSLNLVPETEYSNIDPEGNFTWLGHETMVMTHGSRKSAQKQSILK